jgi:hypothetical protein
VALAVGRRLGGRLRRGVLRRARSRQASAGRRVAEASSVSDATAEIVRVQLREHGASTEAMPGRRIALNTDRPLEATLEEPRRELDRMLVPPPG